METPIVDDSKEEAVTFRRAVPAALLAGAALAGALGCGGGGPVLPLAGSGPKLTVSPASIICSPDRTVQFTAASDYAGDLVWSVVPAEAGSIDAQGRFTPTRAPSACRVVASWPRDPRFHGQASVTVVAPPLPATIAPDRSLVDAVFQTGPDGQATNMAVAGGGFLAETATASGGSVRVRHGLHLRGTP